LRPFLALPCGVLRRTGDSAAGSCFSGPGERRQSTGGSRIGKGGTSKIEDPIASFRHFRRTRGSSWGGASTLEKGRNLAGVVALSVARGPLLLLG